MSDSFAYLAILLLAAVAVLAIIKASALARTRDIEVAYQAQLDDDALHEVVAIADHFAAQGFARPASHALRVYLEQQRRHISA